MVRCADCGFLALRHVETRELFEADDAFRASGTIPSLHPGTSVGRYMFEEVPICFEMVREFDKGECSSRDGRARAVQREIDCERFTQWRVGRTPKEHREMLDRQWMIEREDRRDKEMREREDRRDEKTERLQKELHSRELWILGGAVTMALIIGSVAAAIIEGAVSRGYEPSWWPF